MEKTVIELFAGVGGFRVGLNKVSKMKKNGHAIEKGDWKFKWFNQWEPSTKNQDAFDCYCNRFIESNDNQQNMNICDIDASLIPEHSLLVGGFPCQDYSVARSLSGEKGIEGIKGVLFWEIQRIICEKNTPFVLLENVDRLLKSPAKQRGRDFGIMLRTFNDNGFNLEWRVINAADYGFSQKRRRVFIFAWRKNLKYGNNIKNIENFILKDSLFAKSFPIQNEGFQIKKLNNSLLDYNNTIEMTNDYMAKFESSGLMLDGNIWTQKYVPIFKNATPLKDILENRENMNKYYLSSEQINKMRIAKGSKQINRKNPIGEDYKYTEGSMNFPDNLDLPGRTMLTSESSINRSTHVVKDLKSGNLRFLSPIEAERLQGFPDNWTNTNMSEKRRYFMMGNALVTDIVRTLEKELSKIITNE